MPTLITKMIFNVSQNPLWSPSQPSFGCHATLPPPKKRLLKLAPHSFPFFSQSQPPSHKPEVSPPRSFYQSQLVFYRWANLKKIWCLLKRLLPWLLRSSKSPLKWASEGSDSKNCLAKERCICQPSYGIRKISYLRSSSTYVRLYNQTSRAYCYRYFSTCKPHGGSSKVFTKHRSKCMLST